MFEVVVLQETLMTVLNYLEPTVGKNTQNLGDDCISLESTDTGSLILYTTNTFESTVIEIICSNGTKAAQAPYVNFKRFKGVISTIPGSEYITIKEGVNQLLISFSLRKTPIVINTNNNGMLSKPTIVTAPPSQMIDFPVDFFEKVVTKSSSIIQDSSTVQLMNCVKITVDKPTVTAEAIDVNSMRTFMMTESFGVCTSPVEFLIEASKMAKSLKLFEDFTDFEIGHDNAFTLIKGGNRPAALNRKHQTASNDIVGVWYCIRQLNGAFPSVSNYYTANFLPSEYITVNKQEILNSISRIKAIGDDTSFHTGITIKADKTEFSLGFGSQYGQLEDQIDVLTPIQGSFNMVLNHKRFEEVIKNIPADYIDIGLMSQTAGNFIIKGNSTSAGAYVDTDKFTILSMVGNQLTP